MRRRQQDLYTYALLWGGLSFVAGLATTFFVLPESFQTLEIPKWKVSTWTWVNAHGVPISEQAISNQPLAMGSVNIVEPNPELHMLRVLPPFLVVIATLLVTDSMGRIRDDRDIVEYSVMAAGGYIVIGVGAIIISGARPEVELMVVLLGVLGAAAYLGSRVAGALPIPIFGIVSLGGVIGIGFLVLIGAGAVLAVAIPLGKVAFAGGLGAAVVLWVSKNIDI